MQVAGPKSRQSSEMGAMLSCWAVFENQRWYYGVGWSSPLATDRMAFSNGTGSVGVKKRPPFMGVETKGKSEGMFDGNGGKLQWWVDLRGIESNECDSNGWTYAFNFSNLKNTKSMGRADPEGCLVRRRLWLCKRPLSAPSVPHPIIMELSVDYTDQPVDLPGKDGSSSIPISNHVKDSTSGSEVNVECKVFVDRNMVHGRVTSMKRDGYCGMAQTVEEAKYIAAKYLQHEEKKKSMDDIDNREVIVTEKEVRNTRTFFFTWHRPTLGGSWAGRVYVWNIARVKRAGREDPESWPEQKHVTSVIVFQALREYDELTGLEVTHNRLSYDIDMDPLPRILG
eukprot:CFRG3615T1